MHNKRMIFLIVMIPTALSLFSQETNEIRLPENYQSIGHEDSVFPPFRELRDSVFNEEPLEITTEKYNTALDKTTSHPFSDEAERYYWLGRIEYFYGKAIYYDMLRTLPPLDYDDPWSLGARLAILKREQNPEASAHFDKSLKMIDMSLELKGDYSEGLWARGLSLGQQCLVNGLWFLIGNGPKSEKYAKKAVALNPDDGKALLLLAQRYAFPPEGFYGGNPEKAQGLLFQAMKKENIETDDLFDIYVALANSYTKQNEYTLVKKYYDLALEIYPGSTLIRSERDRVIKEYHDRMADES